MPAIRPRFSLKTLLFAMTLVAAAMVYVRPTMRARTFVRHVRARENEQAVAMSMLSLEFELKHRSILWIPHEIRLEPATWSELLRMRRTVVATSRNERVEFVVTPWTIYPGNAKPSSRF